MDYVTIYTTSDCPYCILVKNFLYKYNVSYTEVQIDSNPQIVQLLMEETGRLGVPQLEINGQWLVGYDPNKIERALNKTNYGGFKNDDSSDVSK